MKKLIILIGIIVSFSIAAKNDSQKDIYLEYTNKVINYEFNLKNINKIKSPFYEPVKYFAVAPGNNMQIKKRVKITLLSIFGDKAYIRVQEFLGEQLIKTFKKWVKLHDKIYDCKLNKLTDTDAVFKCGSKTLYKTINQKIPMLRDKQ
jgi:hypothetical protein